MLVDVRPAARLRGQRPLDITACLGPIVDALREDSVDLSRVRLVCDWIQYRANFRDIVDVRPILAPDGSEDFELAVDLRRCAEPGLRELADAALRERALTGDEVYLEDWIPTRASRIWDFNALYWRELGIWEEATGARYEQALPGGESDAGNVAAVRELIGELFELWDALSTRDALPEELYVVELGVGNGRQARTWLDEFAAMDAARGTEYYRRLQYLMCDYSEHVLASARSTVADHAGHVSSFVLDATAPGTTLGFLRYKVFLIYISNVYDNLPTEEVARIGGQVYRTESRCYLPAATARAVAEGIGAEPRTLPTFVDKLLRLGPTLMTEVLPAHFPDLPAVTGFWRAVWAGVRLRERYVPISGLDMYEIAPRISGDALSPLLEGEGDVRMQVSNGAVSSFTGSLPILHPFGRMVCHDLFVTDVHQYRTGFRGPGKYDGSVVNWVNGPLLAHIGGRRGFDVRFTPFGYREKTNIVTLDARVRD